MAVFQSRTAHPIHTQPVTGAHTEAIDDTVAHWRRTGVLIPRGAAQMIAAWWQAPGNAFSAFSHTGAVLDGLSGEISVALRYARARVSTADQVAPLLALSAYVGACTVAPYLVTHNAPGCLPDGDPYAHTLDYGDARTAWRTLMADAGDILTPDAECACDPMSWSGELCDPCALDALARSHASEVPGNEPDGFGPWDYAVTLSADDGPGHARVFVIARTPMRADDFFAGTGTPLPAPDAALAGTGATVAGAA